MTSQQIAQEIDHLRVKMAEWRIQAHALGPASSALLEEAIHQFSQMIDELAAAREDLERINTDLIRSQMISELEYQRYKDLFENAPLGYLILDRVGRIEACNGAASQRLQIPRELLVGQPLQGLIAERDQRVLRGYLRRSGMANEERETVLHLKRSSSISAEVTLRIIGRSAAHGEAEEIWVVIARESSKNVYGQPQHPRDAEMDPL